MCTHAYVPTYIHGCSISKPKTRSEQDIVVCLHSCFVVRAEMWTFCFFAQPATYALGDKIKEGFVSKLKSFGTKAFQTMNTDKCLVPSREVVSAQYNQFTV